jgi:hypothetical protein
MLLVVAHGRMSHRYLWPTVFLVTPANKGLFVLFGRTFRDFGSPSNKSHYLVYRTSLFFVVFQLTFHVITYLRKVPGSIPNGVTGMFHWHNPSGRTMALGSTQPPTEMSTTDISGDNGIRCLGLTTLQNSCAASLEIWEPKTPGTLRACPGLLQGLLCDSFLQFNVDCFISLQRSHISQDRDV